MKSIRLKSLPTPLERYEQEAYFNWLHYCPKYDGIAIYEHAFAIPNGSFLFGDIAKRAIQGHALARQGVRSGVEDVMILIPVAPYHGLLLEFKRIDGASPAESQLEWHAKHRQMGYAVYVPYGFEEAKAATLEYFHLGEKK
jgi:hypothetical protein